jgi:toxin ParE1/3/4
MAKVRLRQSARRDLIDHFVYLAGEAGMETAERFLRNAENTFELLATQPSIGAPLTLRRPELAALRKWSVTGFDNVLIFYLPRRDGISVVRVLRASRDWWALLGLEG